MRIRQTAMDKNFDALLCIAHGSAAFQILRAAVRLGLFEWVETRPGATENELLLQIPSGERGGRLLIKGLIATGILEPNGHSGLRNSPAIREILHRGEMPLLAAILAFQDEIVSVGQRQYYETLISGEPRGLDAFPGDGDTLYQRLESDPRLQRMFFDYMQIYTQSVAPRLLSAVDFSQARRILDVGGGGGALAADILAAAPQAQVQLLDISFARDVFEQHVGGSPDRTRIVFDESDMHADPFPTGFDEVIFAHQLVIWSPEENLALLNKAYSALNPGGRVTILSSIVDAEGHGPLMAVLDSIYFQCVATGRGEIYSFEDYTQWLEQTGFRDIVCQRLDTWTPHGFVTARRS